MKVGDFVRTNTGVIEKIGQIFNHSKTNITHIELNAFGDGTSAFILDENEQLIRSRGRIIKSSPNI